MLSSHLMPASVVQSKKLMYVHVFNKLTFQTYELINTKNNLGYNL